MGKIVRERDGQEVSLGVEQVIGRSSWCRLRLTSECVSGTHAKILWSGQSWVLQDLGSRNGTLCDDSVVSLGTRQRLKCGSTMVFGDRSETWKVVDPGEPRTQLVPLDNGPPLPLERSPTALPSEEDPQATVFLRGTTWYLEHWDTPVALSNGQVIFISGQGLIFEDPSVAQLTPPISSPPIPLAVLELHFEVTLDEEWVELSLQFPDCSQRLPRRACYYLAMILARARIEDAANCVEEPGWVETSTLLRNISEYQSSVHLNVDVFRLRHTLSAANVLNANDVIERRRGQIRIGVSKLHVSRAK